MLFLYDDREKGSTLLLRREMSAQVYGRQLYLLPRNSNGSPNPGIVNSEKGTSLRRDRRGHGKEKWNHLRPLAACDLVKTNPPRKERTLSAKSSEPRDAYTDSTYHDPWFLHWCMACQYEVVHRAAEIFMRYEVENARECDSDAPRTLVSHRAPGLDDQEVHAQTGRLRRLREEARNERLSSCP
ncbi:hypothetical protein SCHPADRAFT_894645 [Schizopora paradoxa]|uniref:Uncharacterized protein n=1 Tax=Schizopora paradoxa TaxID=27342 RepID=A0A0H2R6L6_9AGAM|nr:hypothetical protein SCHPADRAFT_894645 [Schizopora paradoxa]